VLLDHLGDLCLNPIGHPIDVTPKSRHHRLHGFGHDFRHFAQKFLPRRRRIESYDCVEIAFGKVLLECRHLRFNHLLPGHFFQHVVHFLLHAGFEILR